MAKGKPGAPIKYTAELQAELAASLNDYVERTEIPILKEWCVINGNLSKYIYELPGLSDAIKRCIEKKESQLERKALSGEINVTMAIFSLKQLGWTDRRDIDMTVKDYRVIPADDKLIDADD